MVYKSSINLQPSSAIDEAHEAIIVDDDMAHITLLNRQLSRLGFDCTVFTDSSAALAYMEAASPALVMLDLRMPVIDGEMLLGEIKKRGLLSESRIAVCSSTMPPMEQQTRINSCGAEVVCKSNLITSSGVKEFLSVPIK